MASVQALGELRWIVDHGVALAEAVNRKRVEAEAIASEAGAHAPCLRRLPVHDRIADEQRRVGRTVRPHELDERRRIRLSRQRAVAAADALAEQRGEAEALANRTRRAQRFV